MLQMRREKPERIRTRSILKESMDLPLSAKSPYNLSLNEASRIHYKTYTFNQMPLLKCSQKHGAPTVLPTSFNAPHDPVSLGSCCLALAAPALCPISVQHSAPSLSSTLPHLCPALCPISVQHSAPSLSSTLPHLCPALCPISVQHSAPSQSSTLPHLSPALCPISVQHSAPSQSSTLPHLSPALCPISVQHSAPSLSSTLPHLCPALCPISEKKDFTKENYRSKAQPFITELPEDNDIFIDNVYEARFFFQSCGFGQVSGRKP
ncbi:unnamed protein product [Ranitomeya imitator]|uniref:Uncharacterized protein n=1 Tax=Ranitomeya imitator TaxID=111125 RepID=A0ABN9LJG8_9NEOB|nr:unnamed protein product [Ranitomeya imitator]